MRAIPYLLAFVLGIGAAGLSACGQKSSDALIPANQAGPMSSDLDAVASAVASGRCSAASAAIDRAQADLANLPPSVSDRLRGRIADGLSALRRQAASECTANQPTTDTTQTQTVDTTTIPTTTVDTSTETVPTQTVTTPTETTTIPTATTPTTVPTTTLPVVTNPQTTGGAGSPTP